MVELCSRSVRVRLNERTTASITDKYVTVQTQRDSEFHTASLKPTEVAYLAELMEANPNKTLQQIVQNNE